MKFFDFFKSVYDNNKFTIKNNDVKNLNKNNFNKELNKDIIINKNGSINKNNKQINVIRNVENEIEIFNKMNNLINDNYSNKNKKYVLKRKSKKKSKRKSKKESYNYTRTNSNYTKNKSIKRAKKETKILKKASYYPSKLNRKNLYELNNKKIEKLIKKIK